MLFASMACALLRTGLIARSGAWNTGVCKAAYHNNSGRSPQHCVFTNCIMQLPTASNDLYVRRLEEIMSPNGTKANRPAGPRSSRACASQRAASQAPEVLMTSIKFFVCWAPGGSRRVLHCSSSPRKGGPNRGKTNPVAHKPQTAPCQVRCCADLLDHPLKIALNSLVLLDPFKGAWTNRSYPSLRSGLLSRGRQFLWSSISRDSRGSRPKRTHRWTLRHPAD